MITNQNSEGATLEKCDVCGRESNQIIDYFCNLCSACRSANYSIEFLKEKGREAIKKEFIPTNKIRITYQGKKFWGKVIYIQSHYWVEYGGLWRHLEMDRYAEHQQFSGTLYFTWNNNNNIVSLHCKDEIKNPVVKWMLIEDTNYQDKTEDKVQSTYEFLKEWSKDYVTSQTCIIYWLDINEFISVWKEFLLEFGIEVCEVKK